jgi:hypothetical protein
MDSHTRGGLWLLKEMWDFPNGVPEDQRLDYLKVIMVCARGDGHLAPREKAWVIGYGAACGAHQSTVDALEAYPADEDVLDILNRNMPAAETWGRVAIFDAVRAANADHIYHDDERRAIRRMAEHMGISEETVVDIEELVFEEQASRRRRLQLLFPGDAPYSSIK